MKQKFTDEDIRFLKKHTSLNSVKLMSLLEESSDVDLLIDTITTDKLRPAELKKLSIGLLNKITVFKHSKNTPFDISEKVFISDAIIKHLPSLIKEKNLLEKDSRADEEKSQYYLVLAGFFDILETNSKSNYSLNYYLNFIKNGFRWGKHKEIDGHVEEWVRILKAIRKDYVSTLG